MPGCSANATRGTNLRLIASAVKSAAVQFFMGRNTTDSGKPTAQRYECPKATECLQQRLVKTGGRLIKHARLLLAAFSREPSDVAAVCRHAAEDRGAAVAGGGSAEPSKFR